jgi:hypothetical protein
MLQSPSVKARALALKAIGAFFGFAALFHLAVVLWPRIGEGGSPIRHGVFVLVDSSVTIGFFKRPRFFFWLFCALGLQQIFSHGSAFLIAYTAEHRLDWQSLLVLVIIPIAGWLLWLEYRTSANQ